MAEKKVMFLGKDYFISDQLPILVPILRCFDGYKGTLMSKLIAQMNSNTYSDASDGEFVYWSNPISTIAKDLIKGAARVGVYDLTEFDIVENNPGYKKLQTVCTETMRQLVLSQAEALRDYLQGYDNAFDNAASNITGSGVSVWTSSLTGALLYSAMEESVLRKQAKEADRQFNAALTSLKAQRNSKEKQDEIRVKTTIYYPGCKEAIEMLISYMLSTYLIKLNEYGVINGSEIAKYDLKASSEIMKNLEIIPQKTEVLGKAFEKCPYNSSIYATALNLKLLDDGSVETVKYLKLDRDFKSYLEEEIGMVSESTDIRAFLSKNYYIHLSALLQGVSDKTYKRNRTSKIYNSVVDEYKKFSDLIYDQQLCKAFSLDIKKSDDIEAFILGKLKGIITDGTFDLLKDECGYSSLIDDIKPSTYNGIQNKTAIDNFYIETLTSICRPIVTERLKKEKEEEIKKQEAERIENERNEKLKNERKKKNKTIILTFSLIAMVIATIIVLMFVIIPNTKYKEAKQLMDNHSYLEAIDKFYKIDGNKYLPEIKECQNQYIGELEKNKKYDVAKEYLISVMGLDNSSKEVKDCDYLKALNLFDDAKYDEAIEIFQGLNGYKDSTDKINEANYNKACALMETDNLLTARDIFIELGNYKDSEDMCDELQKQINYEKALKAIDDGSYADAVDTFYALGDYRDAKKYFDDYKEKGSEELYNKGQYLTCVNYCKKYYVYSDFYRESNYNYGMYLYKNGNADTAISYLKECTEQHPEVEEIVSDAEKKNKYDIAISKAKSGMIDDAIELFSDISGYKDSSSWLAKCNEVSRYIGTFDSYSYVINNSDSTSTSSSSGDFKSLRISAVLNDAKEVKFSANGRGGEYGSYYVYFDRYGSEATVDIVNKTITIEYSTGGGAVQKFQ